MAKEENFFRENSLKAVYSQGVNNLRLFYTKVGCGLALFLMPLGITLDYFVYKEHLGAFFLIRMLVDLIIGSTFGLLYTEFGKRNIQKISLFWLILVSFSISWMIFLSEGANSPYYAGLNLVVLAVGVLLHWRLKEALFVCLSTWGMYFAACFLHYKQTGIPVDTQILFNNTYFLILTGIICVTSSSFTSRARFKEFILNYELKNRNEELEQIDSVKSVFFAHISHELKTPLSLVLLALEQILEMEISDKYHENAVLARKNALDILTLINEFISMMRLSDRDFQLKKKPVKCSSFIPFLVEKIRPLADSKKQTITIEKIDTEIQILGDPKFLEKIFTNLLTNAIKYTEYNGKIIVRCKRKGKRVIFEFEDNGIGIREEDLSHIFNPYHRVGLYQEKISGTGLGLSLSRRLVEKHEGTLSVVSKYGKGSTFTVDIPLLLENSAEPCTIPPLENKSRDKDVFAKSFDFEQYSLIPMKREGIDDDRNIFCMGKGKQLIMIVEDQVDMRNYLVQNFYPFYAVLQAPSAEEALIVMDSVKPDLVLLDLRLPGKSGLDLCKQIRNNEMLKDIRIILLTAQSDERSKVEALELGADDFLTKPFNILEVRRRVANLLRTLSLQRDLEKRNEELNKTLSKLKQTESKLVQNEKMSAVGNLAAGLLHEINNPLNFTLTAIEVIKDLLKNENNDDLEEVIEDIEEGMNRIHNIVSDLHTFAYPEKAGQQEYFNLNEALQSALRLISHEVKNLNIVQQIEENTKVWGSKIQIIHVFMNLIINATKAIKEKGDPIIKIKAEPDPEKEKRLKITVLDNGIGIEDKILDKIFNPFFTTRDVGKGTGLGLSICYTIVKNHGGLIYAKSGKGEWTEIIFDLATKSSLYK
jgi:signal transduction histidine kinase